MAQTPNFGEPDPKSDRILRVFGWLSIPFVGFLIWVFQDPFEPTWWKSFVLGVLTFVAWLFAWEVIRTYYAHRSIGRGAVAATVVFLALATWGAAPRVHRTRMMHAFAILATSVRNVRPRPTTEPSGAIRGKLLPIDDRTGDIVPELYNDLPDFLQPTRPSDVHTIARIRCDTATIGIYTNGGGSAVAWTCGVRVVDLVDSSLVGERNDMVGFIPMEKSGSESSYGQKPYGEIIQYLNSLWRR